jgi:hypothetical protein
LRSATAPKTVLDWKVRASSRSFRTIGLVGTLDIEEGEVGAFDQTDVNFFELLANTLRPLWE